MGGRDEERRVRVGWFEAGLAEFGEEGGEGEKR